MSFFLNGTYAVRIFTFSKFLLSLLLYLHYFHPVGCYCDMLVDCHYWLSFIRFFTLKLWVMRIIFICHLLILLQQIFECLLYEEGRFGNAIVNKTWSLPTPTHTVIGDEEQIKM